MSDDHVRRDPLKGSGCRLHHKVGERGRLPTNTFGGQLSAGRLNGFGHLHEACTQIRAAAGARQLAPAPRVVAVANGGGPIAGCLLLTAESGALTDSPISAPGL